MALSRQGPPASVACSWATLVQADPGAAVILLLRREELGALNLARPVLRERRLRLIVWGGAAELEALARLAPDLRDWVTHVVGLEPRTPGFTRHALRAAVAAGGPIAWTGRDLDRAWREAGLDGSPVPQQLPRGFEGLRSLLSGAPTVRLRGLHGLRDRQRVALAWHLDGKRSLLLAETEEAAWGWEVHDRVAPLPDGADALTRAAWLDFEPEALEAAPAWDPAWREVEDPAVVLQARDLRGPWREEGDALDLGDLLGAPPAAWEEGLLRRGLVDVALDLTRQGALPLTASIARSARLHGYCAELTGLNALDFDAALDQARALTDIGQTGAGLQRLEELLARTPRAVGEATDDATEQRERRAAALAELGWLLQRTGRTEEALVRMAAEAPSQAEPWMGPGSARLLRQVGLAQERLGRSPDAAREVLAALTRLPEDPDEALVRHALELSDDRDVGGTPLSIALEHLEGAMSEVLVPVALSAVEQEEVEAEERPWDAYPCALGARLASSLRAHLPGSVPAPRAEVSARGLRLARRWVALEPDHIDAANQLSIQLAGAAEDTLRDGQIALSAQHSAESVGILRQLCLRAPERTDLRARLASGLMEQEVNLLSTGDRARGRQLLEEAQEILMGLLRHEPSRADWRSHLARLQRRMAERVGAQGDLGSARALLQASPATPARDAETQLQLGDLAEGEGHAEQALRHYEAALAIGGLSVWDRFSARWKVGDMMRKLGAPDAALQLYRDVEAELHDASPALMTEDERAQLIGGVRSRIGNVLLELGKVDEARRTYEDVLRGTHAERLARPGDHKAIEAELVSRYSLASVLPPAERAVHLDAAVALARAICERDPHTLIWMDALIRALYSRSEARFLTQRFRAARDDLREAQTILERARALAPTSAEMLAWETKLKAAVRVSRRS